MGELVLVERRDDGVAVVTLNNPKVNALSQAVLTDLRHVAEGLIADPPGAVVITGSIGSVLPLAGNAVYAAAKAGLRAAARILGVELLPRKIRVNLMSPGPTDTEIFRRDTTPEQQAAMLEMMRNNVPMKRVAEPEEMARAVLFLASSDASYINGVDLFVDGGCVEL